MKALNAVLRAIPGFLEIYAEWDAADRPHRGACSALSIANHAANGVDLNSDHPAEDVCSYSPEIQVGAIDWSHDDLRRAALKDLKRWHQAAEKEAANTYVEEAA